MDETGVEKITPGRFWQGFLLAMGGWILDTIVTVLFLTFLFTSNNNYENYLVKFIDGLPIFGLFLAVIWLPVAIIAGFRCRKEGLKETLVWVVVVALLAPVLVGCGFFLLILAVGT